MEAAFRVQPLNKESLAMYYGELKEVDDETWFSAIDTIIKTEDFFPSIACLLRYCGLEPSYDAAGRILRYVG